MMASKDGFKSYDPNVTTLEDVEECIAYALGHQQYIVDRYTSPWEKDELKHDELEKYAVDSEDIDRVYRIVSNEKAYDDMDWSMLCRVDYKGEKYFVSFDASCCHHGFDCEYSQGGSIFITKLPDFFLNSLVGDFDRDTVYRALQDDGYFVRIDTQSYFRTRPRKCWRDTPTLKFLCHSTIYKPRDVLSHFKEHLPKLLSGSVENFIKLKDWEILNGF